MTRQGGFKGIDYAPDSCCAAMVSEGGCLCVTMRAVNAGRLANQFSNKCQLLYKRHSNLHSCATSSTIPS